jgi:hypothetical protein
MGIMEAPADVLSVGAFLEIIENEKISRGSLELLSGLSIHSQSD